MCDAFLLDSTSMGSPGVDTLKWRTPVRPGDTLSARSTVVEVRPSKSRPDRGVVRFRHDVTNQRGETVMTLDNPILFGRTA
jgi:acyl dehydratase